MFLKRPSVWLRQVSRAAGVDHLRAELRLRPVHDAGQGQRARPASTCRAARRRLRRRADPARDAARLRRAASRPTAFAARRSCRATGWPSTAWRSPSSTSRPTSRPIASTPRRSQDAAQRRRVERVRPRSMSSTAAARSPSTSCASSTTPDSPRASASVGEIELKGPSVMSGLLERPRAHGRDASRRLAAHRRPRLSRRR